MMKNIRPGPDIFDAGQNLEQATLVYSIYVTFVLANLLLLPIGLLAIRAGHLADSHSAFADAARHRAVCIVGSFALNGSDFDVLIMLAMGLLGFVLERLACRWDRSCSESSWGAS